MIVEINGQQVELDDSFGSMTPAQQESMINEVASHMGQNTQNQPQRSEPTQSSDSISPVTGAIYGGMIGAIPATAIGATNALGAGAKVLGNAFRDTNSPTPTSTAPTAQAPIPYPEPVQPATVPQAASAEPVAAEAEPIVHGGEKWNKKLTGVHVPGSQMAKEDLAIAEQMAKTVGRGGELAGGEIKNGVMRGPKSLAEMKADIAAQQAAEKAKLLHESRIAQAARDAEITNEAQRRAVDYLNSKQVAPKPTAMQRIGQLGEHLTPTGVAGKTLNSVAPILSMAGAGAEGVDAYNRFNHGDYGRGVISGLGALGSAASMLPNKYARGLGTAAATAAPVINAGLDKLLGREGYAEGGSIQNFDSGGIAAAKKLAPWVKALGHSAHEFGEQVPVKLSDWAQNYMGHWIVPTQADRMAGVGGPSYSANQLVKPEYANRAWGSGQSATATGIANLAKDPRFGGPNNQIFTPLLGSPEMHQSNQLVYDQLLKQFYKDPSKLVDPQTSNLTELANKINNHVRTGGMTPSGNMSFDPIPDFDVTNKNMLKKLGQTFDTRRDIANYVFGAQGIGSRKSQIIPYEQMLKEMSDPMVAGAAPFSIGPRAFKLTGNVEAAPRPDLNAAYPYQLHGEDLNVTYTPTPSQIALQDFGTQWRKDTGNTAPLKSGALRNPGYYEHTLGYTPTGSSQRVYPRQEITDNYIKNLQSEGFKQGGLAHLKEAA